MEARSDCQAITRHKKSNAPYAAAGARRRSIGLFCALAEAYQNAKQATTQKSGALRVWCLLSQDPGVWGTPVNFEVLASSELPMLLLIPRHPEISDAIQKSLQDVSSSNPTVRLPQARSEFHCSAAVPDAGSGGAEETLQEKSRDQSICCRYTGLEHYGVKSCSKVIESWPLNTQNRNLGATSCFSLP